VRFPLFEGPAGLCTPFFLFFLFPRQLMCEIAAQTLSQAPPELEQWKNPEIFRYFTLHCLVLETRKVTIKKNETGIFPRH